MIIVVKVASKNIKIKEYIFILNYSGYPFVSPEKERIRFSMKQPQITIGELKQKISTYTKENPEDLDLVRFEGFFCSRLSNETLTENKDKKTQLGISEGEDLFYCINSTEKENEYIPELSIFNTFSVSIKDYSLKEFFQKKIEDILNDESDPKIKLALLNGINDIKKNGTYKLENCDLQFEEEFDVDTAKRIQEKVLSFKYENIFQSILDDPDLKEVLSHFFDKDISKNEKAVENIKEIFTSRRQMVVAELRKKYSLHNPNRLHEEIFSKLFCHYVGDNVQEWFSQPYLGNTPLLLAVKRGDEQSVECICSYQKHTTYNICLEQQDDNGFPALYYASQQGNLEIVKMLLLAGAQVDDKCLEVTTQENIRALLLQYKQEQDRKEAEAQKFVNLVEKVLNSLKNNSRSAFYFESYYQIIKNKTLSALEKAESLMKKESFMKIGLKLSRDDRVLNLSLQSLFSCNSKKLQFLDHELEILRRVCEAIHAKDIEALKEIKHARDNYEIKEIPQNLKLKTPRPYEPHNDF